MRGSSGLWSTPPGQITPTGGRSCRTVPNACRTPFPPLPRWGTIRPTQRDAAGRDTPILSCMFSRSAGPTARRACCFAKASDTHQSWAEPFLSVRAYEKPSWHYKRQKTFPTIGACLKSFAMPPRMDIMSITTAWPGPSGSPASTSHCERLLQHTLTMPRPDQMQSALFAFPMQQGEIWLRLDCLGI